MAPRISRRIRWLADQLTYSTEIARTHGIKAAIGDRAAAAASKAPTSRVPTAEQVPAQPSATIDHAATLEHRLAVLEGQLAELHQASAELRRTATAAARGADDTRTATLEWLWFATAPLSSRPLISAMITTHLPERLGLLRSAIDSVLAQTYAEWELIVIDDGPTGVLDPLPEWWPVDPRIHIARSTAGESGGARNVGLAAARGEIVAYLDDDCRWFPWWLHAVAAAYTADPALVVAHGIRVIEGVDGAPTEAWSRPHDAAMLRIGNPLDTNVLTHRILPGIVWPTGPNCNDYELAVGLVDQPSRHIPVPAANYSQTAPGRMWAAERVGANMARHEQVARLARRRRPLRIVAHNSLYPQLSETYIGDELAALQDNGIDIVLSREVAAITDTPTRIEAPLYDDLWEAIERHDPDLVFTHWASTAAVYRDRFAAAGIPWAARYHSFDQAVSADRLVNDWTVAMFAHPWSTVSHPLCYPLDTLIADPGPVYTGPRRHQVVSISAALPKKDWGRLFDAVTAVGVPLQVIMATSNGFVDIPDEVGADMARRALPGQLSIDEPYELGQQVIRQSAVLVYSLEAGQPIGQPCSIIEAALAGTPLVIPEHPAMRDLVGEFAHFFDRGSTPSLIAALEAALVYPHPLESRLALAERVRQRHCGAAPREAFARTMTQAFADWRVRHQSGAVHRWWQPA